MEKTDETKGKPCPKGRHRWHLLEASGSYMGSQGYRFFCDRCGFIKDVKNRGPFPNGK